LEDEGHGGGDGGAGIFGDVLGGNDDQQGVDPPPPPPPPRTSFMSNLVARTRNSDEAKMMREFLAACLHEYSYVTLPVYDDDGIVVSKGSNSSECVFHS
jgi:hypothetical protein